MTGDAWLRIMNAMYPGHSCHVCVGVGWVPDSDGEVPECYTWHPDGEVPDCYTWQPVRECPHCRGYGADRR